MTDMSKDLSLKNFFDRLKKLDSKLVTTKSKKQLLPDWWTTSLNKSPSAVQQAIVSMSRMLNLELTTVLDPLQELKLRNVTCQYKKSKGTEVNDLAVATSIIHGLAMTAAAAMTKDYHPLPSALELRNKILGNAEPWVSFETLINICWDYGIPVLHIPALPSSKKMDAVVVDVDGRPVIALTSNKAQSSWLLFHLAHEVGHIAKGHLKRGETLIDEKFNEQEQGGDLQEIEADEYALELLTGDSEKQYYSRGHMTAENLAQQVKNISKEQNVDPGHIVLNWAFKMSISGSTVYWAIAQSTLNSLYPTPSWRELLHQKMDEHFDEDSVSDSEFDYLFRLTGVSS